MKNQENKFEKARQNYKPEEIKFLLIAESPPAEDRFFYFEDVEEKDYLYLSTMRAIHDNNGRKKGDNPDFIPVPELRGNKKEFLKRFQEYGFYLPQ